MLTRVEVTNPQGATLAIPFGESVEGYFALPFDGLDPVKANLVSSSFAEQDGEQYQSSRRDKRNIVMPIGYDRGPRTGSIRDLRNRLYQFLMPKSEVRLRFYDDEVDYYVDIYGRVESHESEIFSLEPKANVSVLCYDPDFYDPLGVTLAGNTTSDTSEFVTEYDGSVETGFTFTLKPNRTMSEFTIYNRTPDGQMLNLQFIANDPLIAGDILTISTVDGKKGATRNRNGVITPVLYGISPYAAWINLYPGLNYIRVYAAGGPVPYTIEYTNKYGGL